jgi:hypothetical protein
VEDLVMKRSLLLFVLLSAATASAEGIDGVGRITLGGGFRWVPNWWFQDKAALAGTPVVGGINGGPQLTASFGYGVSSQFEIAIDLLGSFEGFTLQKLEGAGTDEYTSAAYGAQAGARWYPAISKVILPYLTVQAGPLLSNISGGTEPQAERVLLALSAGGGVTWRVTDHYGVSLDVRYMYARSVLAPISGINVGGVWFGLSFNIFFPPAPKRDLDVPGF